MPNIDELSIEIQANADKATQSIKNLTASLNGLSTALNRINANNITRFAKSMESLSTIGRRTDETSRAVTKFADNIAKSFDIKSKNGIDAIRNAMLELTDAHRKFQQSGGDFTLGENLEDAKRSAAKTIEELAKAKIQVDSTTQSLLNYIKATNKGAGKVDVSQMAKEFGDDFNSMRSVLGSAFISNVDNAKGSVLDFAAYLNQLNGELGRSFDTHTIKNGFKELVTALEKGREEIQQDIVSYDEAIGVVGEYSIAIDRIVQAEAELKSSNGIDQLAESLTKLSGITLPDFSPFADAINALNRASTDRVVKNIQAVKQALNETTQATTAMSEEVGTALSKVGSFSFDNLGKSTSFVLGISEQVKEKFQEMSTAIVVVGDKITTIATPVELFSGYVDEATAKVWALEQALRSVYSHMIGTTAFTFTEPIIDENIVDGRATEVITDFTRLLTGEVESATESVNDLGEALNESINNSDAGGKIEDIAGKLNKLGTKCIAISKAIETASNAFDRLGNAGIAALKKVQSFATVAGKILQFSATKMANDFTEKTKGITTSFKRMSDNVKANLTKMSKFWQRSMKTFTFMLVRKAITAVIDNVKEAMDTLALFEKHLGNLSGGKFNTSLSEIIADFQYIGRAVVAAFEPLINFVVPAINAVASALANVLALVGEFFAAFTGQNYFVKAKKTVVDYGDSIDKNSKKLKEQKKLLLGIDELNVMPSDKDNDSGSGGGASFKDAFDEKPVSDKMKNLANKIKDILRKLFDPLKAAWDRNGEYVKAAFKYMAGEIAALCKSMGRDFLEVWNGPIMAKVFDNILQSVGHIMYGIGHLAKRFREAWDEGGKGKKIFENLAKILESLTKWVERTTRYFKYWAERIDFNPLLDALGEMLGKLDKLADFLGSVFYDVMTEVVMTYIQWMIEEGLPHLMKTIGDVVDAFDFKKIRGNLRTLEKAFEKMAENIHTGVTDAIGNVGKALAEWMNSDEFTKFCDSLAYYMSLINSERVEKLFTGIGKGILYVAESVANFISGDTFKEFVDNIVEWYDSLDAEDIANFFKKIADAILLIAEDLLKFVNSEPFQAFLAKLTEFWNNTDARGLADGIEGIAKAILLFKFTAFVGSGIAGFLKFFGALQTAKNLDTVAKGLKGIGTGAAAAGEGAAAAGAGTATAAGTLATAAGLSALAVADLGAVAADFYNLKDASDTYSGAQQAYTDEVDSALTNLKKIYEKQGPEIAAEWAKTCYDVDITGEGLYGAQNKLWEKIDKEWEGVPRNMYDGFKLGWDDYFGDDGKGVGKLVTDAFEQLVTGVEKVLGIASPSKVFEDIGGYLVEGLWNGIDGGWTDLLDSVGSKLDELLTSVIDGIGSLKDGTVEKFNAFKDGAVQIFEDLKAGASQKFEDAKTAVTQTAGDITSNAGRKFEELKNTAGQKFEDTKSKIEEKMSNTVTIVEGKLNALKLKFQNVNLTSIASNIISGFLNGLSSAWSRVISWASSAVQSLKNMFTLSLQINSPSKVFEEYGEYTVEGFNEGLKKFSGTTEKTIDNWISGFKDVQVNLAPSLSMARPTASSLTSASMSSLNTENQTTNNNVNSQTQVILQLDGKTIYETVIKQNNQQIMRTGRSLLAY